MSRGTGIFKVRIGALVIGAIALIWLAIGDPKNDIAGLFWLDSGNPWELLDTSYSLENCRMLVRISARSDSDMKRGDHECAMRYEHDMFVGTPLAFPPRSIPSTVNTQSDRRP